MQCSDRALHSKQNKSGLLEMLDIGLILAGLSLAPYNAACAHLLVEHMRSDLAEDSIRSTSPLSEPRRRVTSGGSSNLFRCHSWPGRNRILTSKLPL